MDHALVAAFAALGLSIGMLILFEAGRHIGARRLAKDPQAAPGGTGALEGAVFGLLGLLVAFTFSGAGSRFDARRQLIIEEANAIGTAYLRIDLLPASAQPALRGGFRRYVESRLEVYRKFPDVAAAKKELARATELQREIWNQAISACQGRDHPQAIMLLLPALNAMFDITTTRTMAAQTHPPAVIFMMLFGLALTASMLAGYGMAAATSRSWIPMLGFAAATALAVYVILDLEYPRLGLIRLNAFDQVLVELRESMQ